MTVTTAEAVDQIPAQLRGRPWTAFASDAQVLTGVTGDNLRMSLPADRGVLASLGSIVVSASVNDMGSLSQIYFTSRETGADVFKPASVAGQIFVGAAGGPYVYATGLDATSMGDPGLVAISTVDGSVSEVVQPTVAPDAFTSVIGRNVLASPSGRTIVSALCVPDSCFGGVVIDAATGKLTGELQTPYGPSAINDTYAVVRRGGDVTTEIALVSLRSGAVVWTRQFDAIYHAYLTDQDEVVAMTSRAGRASLAVISPSGDMRSFADLSGHGPTLWDNLSSTDSAVLGDGGPFPGNVGADGKVRADVVDLATFQVSRDAFVLDLDAQE